MSGYEAPPADPSSEVYQQPPQGLEQPSAQPDPTPVPAPAPAPHVTYQPQYEEHVAPAPVIEADNWLACDYCNKWRLLPSDATGLSSRDDGKQPLYAEESWHCAQGVGTFVNGEIIAKGAWQCSHPDGAELEIVWTKKEKIVYLEEVEDEDGTLRTVEVIPKPQKRKREPVPLAKTTWSYKVKHDWVRYDEATQGFLEAAFASNMHSAVIRDGDYTVVDLQQCVEGKALQRREDNGYTRKVIREEAGTPSLSREWTPEDVSAKDQPPADKILKTNIGSVYQQQQQGGHYY